MSNPLSVRRVLIQTIDANGEPEGEPSFGVMAADDEEQSYNDSFDSLKELNEEIDRAGCIVCLVSGFEDADPEKVGTDNFYGKNWSS